AFDVAKYGGLSNEPWIEFTIPSVIDPSLAQGSERWHGRSVAIEVIPTHAIQDEQHDNSRSSKIGPQDRQYTACYGREHLHAERSRKRWRNILLHGRHRVQSGSHRRAHKHQRYR